jgi:hypothetical protein
MSRKESTKKIDQPEKPSRAKYARPTELGKLIALMNLVPMNIEMKPITELDLNNQFSNSDIDNEITSDQFNELLAAFLNELLAALPEDFNNYFNNLKKEIILKEAKSFGNKIKRNTTTDEGGIFYGYSKLNYEDLDLVQLELACTSSFINKYIEFYDLRENVRKFTKKRNKERKLAKGILNLIKNPLNSGWVARKGRSSIISNNDNSFVQIKIGSAYIEKLLKRARRWHGIGSNDFPLQITAPILIDENGNDYLGGFARFIGTFDSDRLRICEICSRLFWAKRKDSETCSARCFNNLRQRNHRNLTDEEKAQRKAKREANRQSKNELKVGRERSRKKS